MEIVAALKLAWEILGLLADIIAHLKKVSPDDPAKPIRDAREHFAAFRAATTEDEKDLALKNIASLIDTL